MNFRRLLFLGYILLFFGGCDCEDHELLIEEIPSLFLVSDIYEQDEFLNIEFNKEVLPSSVLLNENFILTVDGAPFVADYSLTNSLIQIPICKLNCISASCQVLVSIENVETMSSQILDGDQDGNNGGLFLDTLELSALDSTFISFGTFETCIDDQTTISPGTFDRYLWSTGDTTTSIMVGIGNYALTVTDFEGCPISGTIEVIEDMSLSCLPPLQIDSISPVSFFPDTNRLTICFNQPIDSSTVIPFDNIKVEGMDVSFSGLLELTPNCITFPSCAISCMDTINFLCSTTITIVGEDEGVMLPLKSALGTSFDGNNDGVTGDSFSFSIETEFCF